MDVYIPGLIHAVSISDCVILDGMMNTDCRIWQWSQPFGIILAVSFYMGLKCSLSHKGNNKG
jgi:hypothetical protein